MSPRQGLLGELSFRAISKEQMKNSLKFVHDDNVYCKYYEVWDAGDGHVLAALIQSRNYFQ